MLSRQFIQAPTPGPRMASVGVDRAEYTVGVQGCNQRGTYMVVCTQGTEGCIAGDRSEVRNNSLVLALPRQRGSANTVRCLPAGQLPAAVLRKSCRD